MAGFAHDLYLARHGQTEWNAVQRMQGRLNSALTPKGRQEAARLRAILDPLDLSGLDLRVSPQGRAVQTAAIALGHREAPLRTDDRLMEIDVGAWSGLYMHEMRAQRPDLFSDDPAQRLAWYDAAPGGEGFDGLKARCESLMADLKGPAVLIAHGITIRMLRSLALAGDTSRFGDAPGIAQGVVYHCKDGVLSVLAPD
ncbi:MAG: phosphoglycerate mutase [Rhodobacterales bacterium]|nr:MAG: phosphoglycerate mutase [Rhodobacterales bacterium]